MVWSETWHTWVTVLTHPGMRALEGERQKPNATFSTALVWIVIASIVVSALGILAAFIYAGIIQGMANPLLARPDLLPADRAKLEAALKTINLGSDVLQSLSFILLGPLSFVFSTGLMYVIGRWLGGEGHYGRYGYLVATFTAPLTILTGVLALLPLVGYLNLFVLIYQLVLTYFAIKVEQRLSGGWAVVTMLFTMIAGLILCACPLYLAGMMLGRLRGLG